MWAGVHHVATHSGWHGRRHDGCREGHWHQDRLHVSHAKGVRYAHKPAQHPSLSHPWRAVLKQQVCGDTHLVLPSSWVPILFSQALGRTGRRAQTSPFTSMRRQKSVAAKYPRTEFNLRYTFPNEALTKLLNWIQTPSRYPNSDFADNRGVLYTESKKSLGATLAQLRNLSENRASCSQLHAASKNG